VAGECPGKKFQPSVGQGRVKIKIVKNTCRVSSRPCVVARPRRAVTVAADGIRSRQCRQPRPGRRCVPLRSRHRRFPRVFGRVRAPAENGCSPQATVFVRRADNALFMFVRINFVRIDNKKKINYEC